MKRVILPIVLLAGILIGWQVRDYQLRVSFMEFMTETDPEPLTMFSELFDE